MPTSRPSSTSRDAWLQKGLGFIGLRVYRVYRVYRVSGLGLVGFIGLRVYGLLASLFHQRGSPNLKTINSTILSTALSKKEPRPNLSKPRVPGARSEGLVWYSTFGPHSRRLKKRSSACGWTHKCSRTYRDSKPKAVCCSKGSWVTR